MATIDRSGGKVLLKGLIVEEGRVGKSGSSIDISGINTKTVVSQVPVVRDFKNDDVIGQAHVYSSDGVLMADVCIDDPSKYSATMYPAIGGIIRRQINEHGVNKVLDFQLTEVSLCANNNDDPHIKPVFEQLEDTKSVG